MKGINKLIKSEKEFDAIPKNERFNNTLEGIAYFASVHKPNTSVTERYGGAPVFKVSIGLEGEQLKKAREMGLRIIEANDSIPMVHVEIKRKVLDLDNEEKYKPLVVDMLQNIIPETVLIGNGSRVIVKFHRFWYPNNGGGVGTVFTKMQVRELVRFQFEDFETDANGFNVLDILGGSATTKVAEDTDSSKDDEVPFDEAMKALDEDLSSCESVFDK